ncbi:hypothetical protein M409DRAFT_25324 [Zasmidium cellare ATCC 36951]|uniref:Cytochrome P450 n=1 Tax=Zasmidium cellare ATCC 36951 TaxID=1080233 RepID=A0A6A6CGA0_ZASCE|nr:uncharacterized protein M409DRAFT_25324 [Zasmidium cellare ATCC 36951]KAF2164446.1 hypothetical protein M409DRAFT_25324 [Zasmidium cellare ATCC 36951]
MANVDTTFGELQTVPLTLIILAFLTAGFILHYYILEPLLYGPLSHIPGPKLASLSGHYLTYHDISLRRNETISQWHRKYGPVVRIRPNEVTLGNPTDYREIYDTKSRYDKSKYFSRFAVYGEDNLFSTLKYTDHQAMKRQIAAAFAKSTVVAKSEAMVRERVEAYLEAMMLEQKTHSVVDVFVLFDCFSHDVMTRFLYGEKHGTDTLLSSQDRPLVVNLKRSQIWTPLWVNFPTLHTYWLGRKLLPKEYVKNGEYGADVKRRIESLMDAHDADKGSNEDEMFSLYGHMRKGAKLNRDKMASEMFDELKAGQMTTASTLTYTAWRLSRRTQWQDKLRTELLALRPDDDGKLPLAELETCPVLEAVIKETLRLHPAASGRQERVVPPGGRTYSGLYVPEGTTVIGPTLVLHLDPDVYDGPLEWRPERWLDASEEKLKSMEYSHVPFGHGARVCIGQHLGKRYSSL